MEIWKIVVIVAVVLTVVGAAVYILFGGPYTSAGTSECLFGDDCKLSLCDCKCHQTGKTPEEIDKIFCGINCKEMYGISGCTCSIGKCKTI
jgi:hypothetical protein